VGTSRVASLASLPAAGRYPMPIPDLIRQAASDRLTLAGDHLRRGDNALLNAEFRFAISRHYYAMYHAARAIVFAANRGDDYERHAELPRHLPNNMKQV